MDVARRPCLVARATWLHGGQPIACRTAACRAFDRSVALLGTVARSRVGRGCPPPRIDRRLASADRSAPQAGPPPRRFPGPVRGRARRRYDALASQPSRDIGTGRRATLPRLEHDPEKWEPVFRKDRTKENDLQSELLVELGQRVCR